MVSKSHWGDVFPDPSTLFRKVLVVVDMQNDFITGPLGNRECVSAVPAVADLILNGGYDHVYATMDSHGKDYADTQEGRKLPVPHCLYGTHGWKIALDVGEALESMGRYTTVEKGTFGSEILCQTLFFECAPDAQVDFAGVCTDICVVSNALLVRSLCPEMRLRVIAGACAGTSPKAHSAALSVMRSCQIEVVQ